MSEVKKLAGQTMIYGLGTIVPRFLNYAVLTPFYTRIFSDTKDYGVITEIYAWMVLLLVILTYGMETGFFRFSQERENSDKVYGTAIVSLFITSTLFIILANVFIRPLSAIMNYNNNHGYIRMFAGIVAIDAFTAIPFAKLRRDNKPALFSAIKIANVIITIGLVFFLLNIAPGLWEKSSGWFRRVYNPDYKVGYVFAANLIASTITLLMVIPVIVRVKIRFSWDIWMRMIKYSFPLLLAGISGTINDALDKIILRRLLGNDEGLAAVGEYGAGYKIGVLMALFIQMYRFAAEPFFFERAKRSGAKESYAFIMKYFIIVMLVIYLIINLYISGFQYIVGANYRESIIVVPIISMAYLLYGIYINHSIWYKLNDLTFYAVYITLIGAAVTVAINLVFVPKFGYIAAAWAHIASYGSMIIFSFLFARNHFVVNYGMEKIVPYFVVALMMVIFGQFYRYHSLKEELIVNSIMLISFIGFAQYRDKILTTFIIDEKNEN